VQEENDVNWLREGYDGRQKKIKSKELEDIRSQLELDVFNLIKNNKLEEYLFKRLQVIDLDGKYKVVMLILNRMSKGFAMFQMGERLAYIQRLKQLRFNMPEINTIEGDIIELNRIYQEAGGLKTKMNMLIDEIKTDGKKVVNNLNRDFISVCKVLECEMLDPKKTSQAYWIEMQKLAQEKIENMSTQNKE
jgi:hypothetical protein